MRTAGAFEEPVIGQETRALTAQRREKGPSGAALQAQRGRVHISGRCRGAPGVQTK